MHQYALIAENQSIFTTPGNVVLPSSTRTTHQNTTAPTVGEQSMVPEVTSRCMNAGPPCASCTLLLSSEKGVVAFATRCTGAAAAVSQLAREAVVQRIHSQQMYSCSS